ncbi:hypothetical protein TSTA_088110 [Talaromyces stipitatus ATCC 10500]|uniref:Thioesterase domain-containing protein n=1 Tax=Talaromyces stipitatus (strain ATCC 10500 / CBS 375.48 / QM 6759 / NRRL 1006) TaxID=441959 RepID=B8M2B1_TALSN|nr:uncharacterized protein TSTA_088110 [Talaromyces stipitatus ATCC 10500]EED21575.1 hypothetical protein TSTA_088110 [Talaromyces stipitatus ATCC 10500]
MLDSNPSVIQFGPAGQRNVPLILFHDGGGTTMSYHYLGDLNRTVYGIHDPRFIHGRPWRDGIPEMARTYANLVRSVVPRGQVILGGWSLGGYLALETAKVLESADEHSHCIEIIGIIMLDSPYPNRVPNPPNTRLQPNRPFLEKTCPPELSMLVTRSMKRVGQMIDKWSIPSWWEDNGIQPPPIFLLRCTQMVPVQNSDASMTSSDYSSDTSNESEERVIVAVDRFRAHRLLGWELYHDTEFIKAVFDVPGHHFNLFAKENRDTTTMQLKQACKMLELPYYNNRQISRTQ